MSGDDLGTVRWFGPTWGAPMNDPRTEIPTPVSDLCIDCGKPIVDGDRGVTLPYHNGELSTRMPFHLACFLHDLGIG